MMSVDLKKGGVLEPPRLGEQAWSNKGSFFSESKVPFSNFPKSVPNHYPEHFLFRYIVLKIVIWHIFWEILKTHHTLWKNTTFNSSLGVTKGMATEKKYPCHMLRASKNSISIFMRTIIFLYCSKILIFSMFVSYVIIKFLCCYAIYVTFFCKIV